MPLFSAYIHRNDVLREYARGKCTASPSEVIRGFLHDCAANNIDERSAAAHVAYMVDKMNILVTTAMAEEHRMQQEQRVAEYDRVNHRQPEYTPHTPELTVAPTLQLQQLLPTPDEVVGHHGPETFNTEPADLAMAETKTQEGSQLKKKKKVPLPRVAMLSTYSATVAARPLTAVATVKSPANRRLAVQSARLAPPSAGETRRQVLRDLGKKNTISSAPRHFILSPKPEHSPKMLIGFDRALPENIFQPACPSSPSGALDFEAAFSPPPVRRQGRWSSQSDELGTCFTRSASTARTSFGSTRAGLHSSRGHHEDHAPTLSSLTRGSSVASTGSSAV